MKAALTYCQVTMLAILQSVSCNFPAVLAIIQPLYLYSLDNQFGKDLGCSCQGNRIISLAKLGDYIHQITKHAADCGSIITFLGEWQRIGLSLVLLSKCTKCHEDFRFTTGAWYCTVRKKGEIFY